MPRIYNKPYIGLGAIKIQLATIEQELENLKQEIKLQKANYEDLKNGQALLNQSKADHIFYRLDLIDEYHNLLKEYQEINDRYEKLILDDSLISLQKNNLKKQKEKKKTHL